MSSGLARSPSRNSPSRVSKNPPPSRPSARSRVAWVRSTCPPCAQHDHGPLGGRLEELGGEVTDGGRSAARRNSTIGAVAGSVTFVVCGEASAGEREQLGLHVAGVDVDVDVGAGGGGDRRRQRGPAQRVGGRVLRSVCPSSSVWILCRPGGKAGVCRGPVSGSRDMSAARIGWCGPAGSAISMCQVPPARPASSRCASGLPASWSRAGVASVRLGPGPGLPARPRRGPGAASRRLPSCAAGFEQERADPDDRLAAFGDEAGVRGEVVDLAWPCVVAHPHPGVPGAFGHPPGIVP